MTRTTGSKNIVPFDERDVISTTSSADIKHLVESNQSTALGEFKSLLRHQKNFLKWLRTRHDELNEAKNELATINDENYRGPKESTYRKYRWYAEHSILLEAINGFEVFYKTTLINLGKSIRNYVPPEKIKGSIDSKILWGISKASIPELVFEYQLYHDLDNIDKACDSLIGAKRYNKNNPNSNLKDLNIALQAVFQIRHTLSHNHGVVTVSDRSKLKILGYQTATKEIIDPTKNNLGVAITNFWKMKRKTSQIGLLRKQQTISKNKTKLEVWS